ncbi:hypothetical protein GYMLUDRAFT_259715 [Collybiopsis luxurians FD-317 M1]|uniref:Cytochrome P450 n=1 Tax=Collybiopsis luxurians FD-317 M1 TaxID=944289 RepID=A0A0D0CJH3_9AGAR|nr:hypothetical protein GYMLUDRAFT_259715 [Collybiopsis luxurians FD-317 M1]
MLPFLTQVVLALSLIPTVYILYCGLFYRYKRRSLKYLRGPPRTSFLLGTEYDLLLQTDAFHLESKWFKEYGTVFRANTYFSEDMLMISDPRALQYVLHTSGYRFPKARDVKQATRFLSGCGIANVDGEVHNRQRKALNPAFSVKQLRQFLELFQRSTSSLVAKWKQELHASLEGSSIINVSTWLPKATLDVMGESAFDYKFGALDGEETELGTAFDNIFVGSRLYPPKVELLYRSFRRDLPALVSNILLRFPTKQERKFLAFLNASKKVGKPMFEKRSKEKAIEQDSKDILSILIRANQQEDIKKSMNEDEVLSQIATFITAGHETTASTTAWMLYSLARNPKQQSRLYQEIREMRERLGPNAPTAQDLDSMPFLNAVIKETLRRYPIIPNLIREAQSDDIIPLQFPVTSVSGDAVSQIPVSKGQRVIINISMYNMLPQVWGDDAEEWNPDRFLEPSMKTTTLGVYANLLTFSAGIRACIGWRFAVIQLQALTFGLLENFEFSPPPSGELDEIQAIPFGLIMPMKKNKWEEGKQMPLFIQTRK